MPSTPPNTSKTALFVECLLVVVVFHAAWAVAYGFLPGLRWALWVGYFLVQCFTALVLSACFHAHALQQHRYWPYLLAGLLPPAAMCGVMGLIDMRLAPWATTYALGGVLFLVAFALIRWTHGHPRKHALQTAQSQRSERVRVRAKQVGTLPAMSV